MKKILAIAYVLFSIGTSVGCGREKNHHDDREEGHGHHEDAAARGPHGGKLFEQDGFGIEITIYEPGIPPQSRVYCYFNGDPISPSSVKLITELHRIDRVDTVHYLPQEDYLLGDLTITEPHSFEDVKLRAEHNGKTYAWSYASYEGRTTLSAQAVKSGGIETEKAGAGLIATRVTLNGRVGIDQRRVARLTARYPGIVRELRKFGGDKVEKGEVIATIEANDSLKTYDLTSPRTGEILDITTGVGELVGTDAIATVGDLSVVWVELLVPKSEFSRLKIGQKVSVIPEPGSHTAEAADGELEGRITYLSPLADGDSQTRLARAEVANPRGTLVPELFVEAKVVLRERHVPVVVKADSIQTFRDWNVVFKKVGQDFEIAILELGETDGGWVEVMSGISAEAEYVTKNSFVVKADVMKAGASHDH